MTDTVIFSTEEWVGLLFVLYILSILFAYLLGAYITGKQKQRIIAHLEEHLKELRAKQ